MGQGQGNSVHQYDIICISCALSTGRVFRRKKLEVREERRKLPNVELHDIHSSLMLTELENQEKWDW